MDPEVRPFGVSLMSLLIDLALHNVSRRPATWYAPWLPFGNRWHRSPGGPPERIILAG